MNSTSKCIASEESDNSDHRHMAKSNLSSSLTTTRSDYQALSHHEDIEVLRMSKAHNTTSRSVERLLESNEKLVNTVNAERHDTKIRPLRRTLWQPFWLKNSTLIGFLSLFVVFIIALLVLWRATAAGNGISPWLTDNSYAWTYGPSLILVIVASLWRQVDYYCKVLSPWHNLKTGPAPASRTVMLDYVSPIQISSLINALRLGNYSTAMSITGFFLLKLAVVLSTGLLQSRPMLIANTTASMILTTNFSAVPFIKDNFFLQYSPPNLRKNYGWYGVLPTYTSYAIKNFGLDPPDGMYDGGTFQTFRLEDDTKNITKITASVDVFKPDVHCEMATIYSENRTAAGNSSLWIAVYTPTCQLEVEVDVGVFMNTTLASSCLDLTRNISVDRQPTPDVRWMNCSQALVQHEGYPYDATQGDYRWLIMLSDMRCNQTIQSASNGSLLNIEGAWLSVLTPTAVICDVNYHMAKSSVSYVYGQNRSIEHITITDSNVSSSRLLPGLTHTLFNQAIMRSLSLGTEMFPLHWTTGDSVDARGVLFGLMDTFAGGDGTYQSLLNSSTMKQAAELTISSVANSMIYKDFLVQQTTNKVGTSCTFGSRLHVRGLSLWGLFAIFVIMIVLIGLFMKTKPRQVVPCNPNTLGACAALLRTGDTAFHKAIYNLGYSRSSLMHARLEKYLFTTTTTDSFALSMMEQQSVRTKDGTKTKTFLKLGQWYPWNFRYMLLLPTVLIPTAAVIILEILQRLSKAHTGIGTVTTKTSEGFYYYGTSLVMLLIATMYNNIDFTVASFAPYSVLRTASLPSKRGIQFHLLGRVPVVALWRTVRARHYGHASSLIASLIGSTLTIVAATLWYVDPAALVSQNIALQRVDLWNTTWESAYDDHGATIIYSLMKLQNLSYPQGTYNELAFPNIRAISDGTASDAQQSNSYSVHSESYQLVLPALRANLNCSLVPTTQIANSIYIENGHDSQGDIVPETVTIRYLLPPECPGDTLNRTLSPSSLPKDLDKNGNGLNITIGPLQYYLAGDKIYFAQMHDLGLEAWRSSHPNYTMNMLDNVSKGVPHGCPSLGIIVGSMRAKDTPPENITAMMCYQEFQELDTALTLKRDINRTAPTYNLVDESSPPIADESSLRTLTNGTLGITALPWQIVRNLSNGLQRLEDSKVDPNVQFFVIDGFFDSLFNVSGRYSLDPYIGPGNAQLLMEDINHAYRQYMAQLINLNMRIDVTSDNELGSVSSWYPKNGASTKTTFAAVRSIVTSRMMVNEPSKLVLQCCLVLIVICGCTSFKLVKIRGTLAHNPCTIAGMMSLLAGSELCKTMVDGSEYFTEKQLEKYLSDSGFFHSLGWWNSGGEIKSGDDNHAADVGGQGSKKMERFGVDIGKAKSY